MKKVYDYLDKKQTIQWKQKSDLQPGDHLKHLVDLATQGHYPLFFKEDLVQSQNYPVSKYATRKYAREFVEKKLNEIAPHNSYEKKKLAITGMPKDQRYRLINCFMKLVDEKSLNKYGELH